MKILSILTALMMVALTSCSTVVNPSPDGKTPNHVTPPPVEVQK